MNEIITKTFEANDIIPALGFWSGIPGIVLSEGDDFPSMARFLQRNPELSEIIYNKEDANCEICAPDDIIGTLLAGHDGRRGFLYHVVVNPKFQGRDIGKGMVERAIKRFEAIGIQKVQLLCLLDNARALSFWAKMRFSMRTTLATFSRSLKK